MINYIFFKKMDMEDVHPIFDCCERNDIEGLKTLIQLGVDLNVKDDYGENTPLHFAAFYNSTECFQLLIEAGADVNAKDNKEWTPLHFAAFYNSKECLQILLEEGAEINAKDKNGKTPLEYIKDEIFKKEMEEYANDLSTFHLKEPEC